MMDGWIESWPKFDLERRSQVLRDALAQRSEDARLHIMCGEAFSEAKRYEEALRHFETAVRQAPELAAGWSGKATSLRKLGRPAEVIALCDNWRGNVADREFHRGRALIRLGEAAAGEAVLRRLVRVERRQGGALRALLESLARAGDGAEILATLEQIDGEQRATALARAYRAAALSMLGRTDEACTLVDLGQCVGRYRFRPSAGLGSTEEFNDRLANIILAATPPDQTGNDAVLNYQAPLSPGPEIRALRTFFRDSVVDYLQRNEVVLAAANMPPAPRRADLSLGTVVLRRGARNGQHIHPISHVSAVYHVRVPDRAAGNNPHDGALVLGPCDLLTGGHRACWGERYVEASGGWLTIFPSHVFHDVMPTHRDAPRISVVSDVIPKLG